VIERHAKSASVDVVKAPVEGLIMPYPPKILDVDRERKILSELRPPASKGSTSVFTSERNSLKEELAHMSTVHYYLQREFSGENKSVKQAIASDPALANAWELSKFIDKLNVQYGMTKQMMAMNASIGKATMGAAKNGRVKDGDKITVTVPHEIDGCTPWFPTRNRQFVEVKTKIFEGVHVDTAAWIDAGFTPLDLISTGVRISDLIERNDYTLEELGRFGVTWEGLVEMGLDLESMRHVDQYPIDVLIELFPNRKIHDYLMLGKEEMTATRRLRKFFRVSWTVEELDTLGFSFYDFHEIMDDETMEIAVDTGDLSEMTNILHLTGDMLRARSGFLSTEFFVKRSWGTDVGYICKLLNVPMVHVHDNIRKITPQDVEFDETNKRDRIAGFIDEPDMFDFMNPSRIVMSIPKTMSTSHQTSYSRYDTTNLNRRKTNILDAVLKKG
jgi:hypothetical protein